MSIDPDKLVPVVCSNPDCGREIAGKHYPVKFPFKCPFCGKMIRPGNQPG